MSSFGSSYHMPHSFSRGGAWRTRGTHDNDTIAHGFDKRKIRPKEKTRAPRGLPHVLIFNSDGARFSGIFIRA